MREFNVTVHILIKHEVLNPEEGPTVEDLKKLNFHSVRKIQMGKCYVISLSADSEEMAHDQATGMCRRLLANPVTESFEIRDVVAVKQK